MFPVDPSGVEIDERGLFVVQDPELRSRIMPLFSFDPEAPERRPIGHGTTFRIDLWSRCATAYHVIEGLLTLGRSNVPVLRADNRLVALELNGLVYGQVPVPTSAWRPIAELFSYSGLETLLFATPSLRNVAELAALTIRPSELAQDGTPFLTMDLRQWRPRIGERVLALGYADLDLPLPNSDDARPIVQYLYGSFGEIVDVERPDFQRGRPWPLIRVAAAWPGGMSGGPVFGEAGHVIGVVSAGLHNDVGSATYFSAWDIPTRIFGSLDPSNPGWFFCHGVFDGDGQLRRVGQDLDDMQRFAVAHGLTDIGPVSLEPYSGDYIRRPSLSGLT